MISAPRDAPRLSDERFGQMSVCICLLCRDVNNHDVGEHIVFVEDRKVTFTGFSADGAVSKHDILVQNWWVQYAGNDVDTAPLVIEAVRSKITGNEAPRLIGEALQEAWTQYRDKEIETRILRKHGYTFESFRDEGREKCGESVYDQLHDRIDAFKFSLEFMLAGFDSQGIAHLMAISRDGALSVYSELGFWAIGSGAHAALSSLSFHVEHNNLCSCCSCVHNAVYFGCEAKFMAETSNEVGKEATSVTVHEDNEEEPQSFFNSEVEEIKKRWLKYGAPKPSEKAMLEIHRLMEKAPSARFAEARAKHMQGPQKRRANQQGSKTKAGGKDKVTAL